MADNENAKAESGDTVTTATEEEPRSEETAEGEVTFVEDPAFEVDYKGECAYEVKVTIPVANERNQADKMFDELKHEAEVPGFRPGRAPRKLIERKFGKAVKAEVAGKLVSAAFQKLIEEKDLKPIQMPDVEGLEEQKDRADDEPLTFTLKFEVAPRVELGKYRGIEVERPVLKIDDTHIEETIADLRARYAVFETLKKGAAKEGDQVIMGFKGTVAGKEFPGGSASDYPYILGTQRFFPEFEEVLKGASAGDHLECTVVLPDNNPNEELRGKEAHFTIEVKEVKRRKLPDLNDDFAKQAGYKSAADLREKVTAQLREATQAQGDRIAEARALSAIVESSTYEIPKRLVEGVAEELYEDEVRRLLSMRVPVSQIEENDEELKTRSREGAVNQIKRLVALNEIGDAEGIEVTEQDFEQEVEAIAQRTGAGMDVVTQYLGEGDRRSSYEGRILRVKAMKVVMDAATVTDKEVSREELSTEDEGDHGDDA